MSAGLLPDPACSAVRHGTRGAYAKLGCKCPAAREADRIYRKRLRHGLQPSYLVDATGSRRRLQALAVLGWPSAALAPRLGLHTKSICDIRSNGRKVHRTTAARIRQLYRDLVDVQGPSQPAAARARARGWVSPLAWDDIDDPQARPVLGRLPPQAPLRSVEEIQRRREEICRLWRSGLKDVEIAELVGASPNAVKKLRHRWLKPQHAREAA